MRKNNKGVQLAWLLRHDRKAFDSGIIDINGYRTLNDLIGHHGYSRDLIDEIVRTNNKKRFEYDESGERIRARQGHSIPVEIEMQPVANCDLLWHGTSDRFIASILKDGLKPQSRLHVHLSKDMETAESVGARHGGNLCVIKIDAKQMLLDGKQIWLSNNGVYLTDSVEPNYFIETKYY
jgi:putative RNA 2'-phosphotransferase